jgi:hypothetical protein
MNKENNKDKEMNKENGEVIYFNLTIKLKQRTQFKPAEKKLSHQHPNRI